MSSLHWIILLMHLSCIFVNSFVIINEQESSSISLHPLSPAESDPHELRAKRQAYQVYVGDDVSVTVDKSGQPDSGVWGHWNRDGECSRTCGGGVLIEKRQCNGVCSGPSVRYVSCNTDACPDGSKDFRAEQCEKYNDSPLDGNYYKWLPHRGKNKCELACRPENGNFYYKWSDKVTDGTKCDHVSNDICVEGVCLPLGCDGKLGSAVKEDKCGVCGGNASTCKTVAGVFDERNLTPGYHDIIVLPAGATSIKVEEIRPTTNSLALRNASGFYYLNGNFQIQVLDKELEAGGTLFDYDKRKENGHSYERLTAKGPLTEDLTISMVFQSGNKDSAIQYEFSVPLEQDIPYIYRPGVWSECSVTCGKGVQTRTPVCIEQASQNRVHDDECELNNATKPETNRTCETTNCNSEWFVGEWETCSLTCGEIGWQYRVIYCHQVFADGKRVTVDDAECTDERPAVKQECNRFACPEWNAGPWSACSEKCGDALQYRSVTCRSEKSGEEGKLLPADACDPSKASETERTCNLGPCQGLKFVTTDWILCQKCNDTDETRNVSCKDTTGRAYPLEKCHSENVTETPIDTRSCATPKPCIYEWHTSEWSKCSTDCGHGHQTRRVVCAIHELGDLTVVDESHCNPNGKPMSRQNCTNEVECTGTYYTAPWSDCTANCSGGTQTRMAVCLNYDKMPVPDMCDEAQMPVLEQTCNTEPCPTCFDGDFGCCPDNSTYATGPYFEGCSNCSTSEYGCCDDNITEASGPKSKGCIEFVESDMGSGEEPTTNATMETVTEMTTAATTSEELCEVTDEATGDVAKVPCPDGMLADLDNATLINETSTENVTIHCSKTEFGCCPDWYTPAEGAENAGCPKFIQGICNDTKYGCCLDEVTLARGPNYEGCGEPTCAASLYGCCKDRKTIAFGAHYTGCERSSFPCELSEFGCCPDGETGALGANGKGCGENCLLTKYGCCPDGVTVSKSSTNTGCGCQYSQYGCCPDGKSSAQGPGYSGCPDTCAQSQYGCCPDGKTVARGSNKEGCPCQYTQYGCCPDGETTALGAKNEGCDDCRYAKYRCCPDGETKALGPNYAGCPVTTQMPIVEGGTVSPSRTVACSLPKDQGSVCGPGYKLLWHYDIGEGRCTQFWYGGCDGNENRFMSQTECETVCINPPGQGRCYLPKVEGPTSCNQLAARYWYDYESRQCGAFWYRGCLGNSNRFESWESCQSTCEGVDANFNKIAAPPTQQQSRVPAPIAPQQNIPAVRLPPAGNDDSICRQTADAGRCKAFSDRWYFDEFSGACQIFIYGGCGGNSNNFDSKAQCESRCGHLQRDLKSANQGSIAISSKTRDVCNMRMDVGRCEGQFDMYYYEVATGTCENFKYSGCGGNGNRFQSITECEALCVSSSSARIQPRVGLAGAGRLGAVEPSSDARVQPRVGLAGAGRVDTAVSTASRQAPQSDGNGRVPICEQERDTGPCDKYVTKWYYNRIDGTCQRFHYSGCEGTENRFDTENECKTTCGNYADPCELPKVVGPCHGRQPRFHFDRSLRRCVQFDYGGCLGNANNFMTVDQCRITCEDDDDDRQPEDDDRQRQDPQNFNSRELSTSPVGNIRLQSMVDRSSSMLKDGSDNRIDNDEMDQSEDDANENIQNNEEGDTNVQQVTDDVIVGAPLIIDELPPTSHRMVVNKYTPPSSLLPELCTLPEDAGPCFDSHVHWRYDTEASICVSFMYTGCNGNANRFASIEECERACEVCTLQSDRGSCTLSLSKWYYDTTQMTCRPFIYSGCGGNGNRFSTREECNELCRAERVHHSMNAGENVCRLERDSGPCGDAISQWYYDMASSQCKLFTFGGCRGNGNRFPTKSQCEHKCRKDLTSSALTAFDDAVCLELFETGPCRAAIQRWYFDSVTHRCRMFTFGGCEGNRNNFDSENECTTACAKYSKQVTVVDKRAIATLQNSGPFRTGGTIIINCQSYGDHRVRWYFGHKELLVDSADQRIQTDNSQLKIFDSRASDSGFYSCVSTPNGLLSDPVEVTINEAPMNESCRDKGGRETCELIMRAKLCSTERYGKFCCQTCANNAVTV